ncbi:MAG: alkaline phosphatase family protein [Chloroflexota bacterium]
MTTLNSDFIKPQYGQGCFADIPMLTRSLLTGNPNSVTQLNSLSGLAEQYDVIILLFIDSFGWQFFEKYSQDYPFLRRFQQDGIAARWTSQFPSTTTSHVTTIHTALPVGQSGMYEWTYYEPLLDALIAPLLFSFAGTTHRDTLKGAGIQPDKLYPTQTFYQTLRQEGVASHLFQHREYTPSTYSDVVFQGAEVIPYRTLPEALSNLHLILAQGQKPAYFFLYFDKIDTINHAYGPTSPQSEAEITTLLTLLENQLLEPLGSLRHRNKTLLMVTADHGHISVDPNTVVYLNLDPSLKDVIQTFRKTRQGQPIVPAGSPRDMFLYIEADALSDAKHSLAQGLAGIADVVETDELLALGYFGAPPFSPALTGRLGNLVILPYAGESVWWYEKGKYSMTSYGYHGGLTRLEAEIPLLLLEL